VSNVSFFFRLLVLLLTTVLCNAAYAASFTRQINASSDDAEERVNSGTMVLNSSDLEINFEGGESQLVAFQFRSINIPQGATICSNTYLQFEANADNKEITNLVFYADDSDDADNLSDTDYDISGRSSTTAQVSWDNVPAWINGTSYQTPSLQSVVQEIINRGGWSTNNDIVMIVKGGGGSRVAAADDSGGGDDEPRLHIEYNDCGSPTTLVRDIDNRDRDVEEDTATGEITRRDDDLELVQSGTAQLIGLRFTNLAIPAGATITSAIIRFTTDEVDADDTSTTIFAELNTAPATFSSGDNISSRTQTGSNVSWDDIPAWSTVGESGPNQTTPDVATLVQEVIDLGSWGSGDDIAFIFEGWGERTAEAFDGDSAKAAELAVTYVLPVPGEANIAVIVSDSLDPVPVNTTYNYEIDVTNFGPEIATDVTLTNILPGALSFVSSFTDQGTCTETGGTVDCIIGSIAADATVIVTIFVTAPGTSQTINNTVTIAASSTDSQTTNDTETESTNIGGNTEQLCYIFSDSDNRLSLYDTSAGAVTDFATNSTSSIEAIGWDSANEILYGADGGQLGILSQVNGSWATVGSGFGTGNGSAGFLALNDVDGMAFNAFGAANVMYGIHERGGQDALFQIDLTTGTFVNNAFAGDDYILLDVSAITDDIAIDVTNGQLYGVINTGGSTDTLITINKETGVTTAIALVTIDDAEGLGSDPSGQLWGTSGTRDTVFEIDKFTGVGSNERALNFGDYEAVDCVGVSPTVGADLFVLKTVDNNIPSPGQNITYTVTLTNNGAADATGIQLADELPAQVTYVSHLASQGTYDPVSGFWLVGSVASSGSRTLDVLVTVTTPLGNSFSNTASISAASQPDPDLANNSATVPVTVTGPSLTLVKTSSASNVSPGVPFSYKIKVTNTGNGVATNVILTDLLPQFIVFGLHAYGDELHFDFNDDPVTPSSLSLGTPIFDDGVGPPGYTEPPGPSLVFDPNVIEFELPMIGNMNPSGGNFTIDFQVQVGL
jgi:uncharacterized repeat protein (TIGR01451 family)